MEHGPIWLMIIALVIAIFLLLIVNIRLSNELEALKRRIEEKYDWIN